MMKSRRPYGAAEKIKRLVRRIHFQDGEMRLCLVDDLKVFKITISLTRQDKGTSSCLKSKDTTTYSQDKRNEVYELKTKDEANSKTNVPVSKSKVLQSVSANKKEPSKSWGSITSDVPTYSLNECSHGPTQRLSIDSCFISHRDYKHFYWLSYSELVDIEKNIRVILFTMKMEILLEPTSNKLMVDPYRFEGIYKDGHGGMSMSVQKSQVHKMAKLQDGEMRLYLVDDLKVSKITISLTSQDKGTSSCLKSKDTTSYSQDKRHEVYELKTKDKA
ncbi:hypothetical protein Tco_0489716 [Tanacetum coccineum]